MPKPHFKLKTTAGTVSAKPQNLTAHLAVMQKFWGAGGFGGLLANPDPVLKRLGRNIEVYRELLGDAIVAGHVRRRKAAVTGLEWRLEDDGVPPDALETVDGFLNTIPLYDLINSILDAVLFGYQPLEIIWQADKYWLPEKIIAKPQRWFEFDSDGRLYFTAGNVLEQRTPVPDYKFLCPTHNASYTNPYGTGDLSCVYWPTVFKRGGLKFWAEFAEKFGAPWIIGYEPRSNTDADTEKLLDSLEQLIGNAVATMPDDSSVEIKEAAGKQGSADVYDRFIRYCRSEIAIALLGQDQTTEKDTTHASEMVSLTEDNFESESWGGERWPRSGRSANNGGKTLQLSGQLAGSISTKVGNDFARIGSNKKYAAIHHLGGAIKAKNKPYLVFPVAGGGFRKVKSVKIPARPYLPINGAGQLQNGAERSLLDIALKSLSKGL